MGIVSRRSSFPRKPVPYPATGPESRAIRGHPAHPYIPKILMQTKNYPSLSLGDGEGTDWGR